MTIHYHCHLSVIESAFAHFYAAEIHVYDSHRHKNLKKLCESWKQQEDNLMVILFTAVTWRTHEGREWDKNRFTNAVNEKSSSFDAKDFLINSQQRDFSCFYIALPFVATFGHFVLPNYSPLLFIREDYFCAIH